MKITVKNLAALLMASVMLAFQTDMSAQERVTAASLKAAGNSVDDERVHPRDAEAIKANQPAAHWESGEHYYGYNVKALPGRAEKVEKGTDVYYCSNGVWFRPYNAGYVVSRPPVGTPLAADPAAELKLEAVTVLYFNTVANAYNQISEKNKYIAQQNAAIARRNATIANQNLEIAQTQSKASAAYGQAGQLGLIQNFGDATVTYYYQDGVFYTTDDEGKYVVTAPPAGAVVESIPEDFEAVMLKGRMYYSVDNTIYRLTMVGGKPYLEVLGMRN